MQAFDNVYYNYIGMREVTGGVASGPNIFPVMGTTRATGSFITVHHNDKWGYTQENYGTHHYVDHILSPRWPAWVNIR